MATKPTERILDWASGGTVVDPGGAKEAAGWNTGERPPAHWWNWVWNSFGKWLSWSETSIDDIETKTDLISVTQAVNLDDLAARSCWASFMVTTDTTSGTPTIGRANGEVPDGSHLQLGAEGSTGGLVRIAWASPSVSLSNAIVNVTGVYASDFIGFPMMDSTNAANIEFKFYNTSGTIIDFDNINDQQIYVTVWV